MKLLIACKLTVGGMFRQLISGMKGIDIIGEVHGGASARNPLYMLNPNEFVIDIEISSGMLPELFKNLREEKLTVEVFLMNANSDEKYEKECLVDVAYLIFDKTYEFTRVTNVLQKLAGHHLL